MLSQTDREMDRQKGMVSTCHFLCTQHLIKMYVESYKYVLMSWLVKGNNLCIPHYCTKTDKLQWSINIQCIKCWCVEHRSCTVKQHSVSAVQDLRINIKSLKTNRNKTEYGEYLRSVLTCFSHPTTLLTPDDTSPGTSNGVDSTKSVHFDLIAAWAAKLAIIKLNWKSQCQIFSKVLYVWKDVLYVDTSLHVT